MYTSVHVYVHIYIYEREYIQSSGRQKRKPGFACAQARGLLLFRLGLRASSKELSAVPVGVVLHSWT